MPLLLLQCIRICGYTWLYVAVVSHNSRLWWGIPMVKCWIAGSLRITASWITSQVWVCFGYTFPKTDSKSSRKMVVGKRSFPFCEGLFSGAMFFRECIFRWIVTTGMRLALQVIICCHLGRIPIWLQCGGCLCNLGKRRSCRGGRGVRNYIFDTVYLIYSDMKNFIYNHKHMYLDISIYTYTYSYIDMRPLTYAYWCVSRSSYKQSFHTDHPWNMGRRKLIDVRFLSLTCQGHHVLNGSKLFQDISREFISNHNLSVTCTCLWTPCNIWYVTYYYPILK